MKKIRTIIILIAVCVTLFFGYKLFPFLIVANHMIQVHKSTDGSKSHLHQYHNTPCENKVFTVEDEIILLENGKSAMSNILYGISRLSFDVYDEYRKHEGISFPHDDITTFHENQAKFLHGSDGSAYSLHKELKLYPIGSQFKILSFYKITKRGLGVMGGEGLAYYMVQSLEDNRTAWMPVYIFSNAMCTLDRDNYDSSKFVNDILGKYDGIKIEDTEVEAPKYSSNDEIYAISKNYFDKNKKRNKQRIKKIKSIFDDANTLEEAHEIADKESKKVLLLHVADMEYVDYTKKIVENYFQSIPNEIKESFVKIVKIEDRYSQMNSLNAINVNPPTVMSPTFYIFKDRKDIDSYTPIDCQSYRDNFDLYSCFEVPIFSDWLKNNVNSKSKTPLPGFYGTLKEAFKESQEKNVPLGVAYFDKFDFNGGSPKSFKYRDIKQLLMEIKKYPEILSDKFLFTISFDQNNSTYKNGGYGLTGTRVILFDKWGVQQKGYDIKNVIEHGYDNHYDTAYCKKNDTFWSARTLDEAKQMSMEKQKPILTVLATRKHCKNMERTINYVNSFQDKFITLLLIEKDESDYQHIIKRFSLKNKGDATLILWDLYSKTIIEHDITYFGFNRHNKEEKLDKKILIDKFRKIHNKKSRDYMIYDQDVKRGVPPIFAAIQNRLYHKLEELLLTGVDIEMKNKFSDTPLKFAFLQNDDKLMQILLEYGANPNVGNGFYTLLSNACVANRISTVKLLLEYGADVNYQYQQSESALKVAAKRCKNFELVQLLFDYGAKPNLPDSFGMNIAETLYIHCGRDKQNYKRMLKLISDYSPEEYPNRLINGSSVR